MGISPGIGIDMIESESVPTMIDLKHSDGTPKAAKNFAVGQYTMLIQDEDNELYQTGLRLNYEPKHLQFDDHVLNVDDIKLIACGQRNYTILTNDNDLLIWGNVMKLENDEQPDMESQTEGFSSFNGNRLFDNGTVKHLELKNNIFGALVEDGQNIKVDDD